MELTHIYLNRETFLWANKSHGIIYNSLKGEGFEFKNEGLLKIVIEKLQQADNFYCVALNDKDDISTISFLRKLIETDSGGIIEKEDKSLPINLPPVLNLNIAKKKKDNINSLKEEILDNLKEVNIYLNGICNLNCKSCGIMYKQFDMCCKSSHEVDSRKINTLLSQINITKLSSINLLGGDLNKYTYWNYIFSALKEVRNRVTVSYYYKQLKTRLLSEVIANGFKVRITIDFPLVDFDFANKFKDILSNKVIYRFIVESDKDIASMDNFINEHNIEDYEVFPFLNNNFDFVKKHFFIKKEELLRIGLSKRQIFVQETLNSNFFGVLYISPNLSVFSNMNNKPIGSLFSKNIKDLIFKEMKSNSCWFLTRDYIPICKSCLYKRLCPPPNSLDLQLSDHVICHD